MYVVHVCNACMYVRMYVCIYYVVMFICSICMYDVHMYECM